MTHRNTMDDIKTELPPNSGSSLAETCLLADDVRCTRGVTPVRAFVWNLRTWFAMVREKAQAEEPRDRKYRCAGQGRTAP